MDIPTIVADIQAILTALQQHLADDAAQANAMALLQTQVTALQSKIAAAQAALA